MTFLLFLFNGCHLLLELVRGRSSHNMPIPSREKVDQLFLQLMVNYSLFDCFHLKHQDVFFILSSLQQKDLAISQEKKEQLKRMSDRQKWEWIQQLQTDNALSPRNEKENDKDSSSSNPVASLLPAPIKPSSVDEQSIGSSGSDSKTSPMQSPKSNSLRYSSPTPSSPGSSPRSLPKVTTEAQLGSSQSGISKGNLFRDLVPNMCLVLMLCSTTNRQNSRNTSLLYQRYANTIQCWPY